MLINDNHGVLSLFYVSIKHSYAREILADCHTSIVNNKRHRNVSANVK